MVIEALLMSTLIDLTKKGKATLCSKEGQTGD